MKDLKYIAKVEGISIDRIVDEINEFIDSMLLENEYIIDVRIVKLGEQESPGNYAYCKNKDCDLIALIYVGRGIN